MKRGLGRLAPLILAMFATSAHVGSPNILFEGAAGPYPVRVVIRPPGVIPGQAGITVRALAGGVTAVSVQPVRWNLGVEGAPRPDVARPVEGNTSMWTAQLWLMEFGSYSVRVLVNGDRGEHTVIVPVAAMATQRLGMPAGLALALIALGSLLLVGALTIVGAAVREAVLPPGSVPDPARVRRAWIARAVAGPLIVLALLGGGRWWDAEDAAYLRNMYRPLEVATTVSDDGAGAVLTLAITDPAWSEGRWSPFVPDHGKLMHMFLIREPQLDAFAHLHPLRIDSSTFRQPMPPLPAGTYRVYADVVHESGFTQTLVDRVTVPEMTPVTDGLDSDDSWFGDEVSGGDIARLADGSTLHWERPARIEVGAEVELRFMLHAPDGTPGMPEPYMGMPAHAAVTRDDGAVFVHLHPMGTVSLAAHLLFEQRARGDTARDERGGLVLRDAGPHDAQHDHAIAFPYEFPQPGRYRIWVQVKRDGRVLTGAFDTMVE